MGADASSPTGRTPRSPLPGEFLFETLDVYQKALSVAERTARLTSGFNRSTWYLADQLNRASLSVALNIAEGNGRGAGLDRRRFLLISRGSVHECVAALDLCRRLELLPLDACRELRRELYSIARMLSAMIGSTGGPKSVRDDEEQYGAD
jgi:four helix bundle protein